MAHEPNHDDAPNDDEAPKAAGRLALYAGGGLFLLMAIFPFVFRLEIFDSGVHIPFAMFLGVVGTIVLGVGLMALTFYSARSGRDDEIGPDETL